MSTNQDFNYRAELKKTFEERRSRNPLYSLRSFARDLEVSVTALSDVLTAKRNFSKKNARKIIEKLHWSPLEQKSFLESINSAPLSKTEEKILKMQDDQFKFISEWYYLPILNLAKIENNKASPKWISGRLGISVSEAKEALQRLKSLGYIRIEKGKLVRLADSIKTTSGIPSAAIRKYHIQNLAVIQSAMENQPIEKRKTVSFTAAIDPKYLDEIKEAMDKFENKVLGIMNKGTPTEVYSMTAQLFPPTKANGKEK
jgi:uncharacterized protein (TIGR02147 family)